MSRTGLDVFDTTLDKTNAWLNLICERLGPDRQRAYHALRSVLHVLRDRLTVDQACHLAAQLPMLVRGIYFEGYHPAGKPKVTRTQSEFLELVGAGLKGIRPIGTREAATAVFEVLEKFVGGPEIEQVKQALPSEIRKLWSDGKVDDSARAGD